MDDVAKASLEAEMVSGEKLRWFGRPPLGLQLYPADLAWVPNGLFMLLLSIFVIANLGLLAEGRLVDDFIDKLFVLLCFSPFFFGGLYVSFVRFVIDIVQRSRIFYGITDRRVIIRSGLFRRRYRSFGQRYLAQISFQEGKNGKGTISLGPPRSRLGIPPNFRWPGIPKPAPSFESIPDARRVYHLVRDIQLGSAPPDK